MITGNSLRRPLVGALLVSVALCTVETCRAQQRQPLAEPVFRVTKVDDNAAQKVAPPKAHPLDPALKFASDGLAHLRADIRDYTATVFKRERIKGKLLPTETMQIKIRQEQVDNGQIVTPFSIYLKYTSPSSLAGREAIYIQGHNNNKLIGHERPGPLNLIRAKLDPKGFLAMRGQRYPITELGFEVLAMRLLEKGQRDLNHDECDVEFFKDAKINGRLCTAIVVKHPERRPHFDFHIAHIFIDNELNVPIRYAAYTWPTKPGGKPVLEEEYTYVNIELNVDLTDKDFDPDNPAYNYP